MVNHRAAVRHLKRSDPVLAAVISRVGTCRLDPGKRPDVFHALARSIIYQQLNGTAAGTIYRRFKGLYPGAGFPTPERILATPVPRLRAAGLSPQKAGYIRDLAAKVEAGEVDLRAVRRMGDDEAVEELTKVKGVGRWTAEMVLMFTLGRPDVLPVDDYGFRRAVMLAYGMRGPPKAERLERLARPWRPYRSVATWYFWQSLDIEV
ncbi:MAG TPA: DNA-3-methyladenine glycosylase [Candidatus Thermoplasmatota archaeon]